MNLLQQCQSATYLPPEFIAQLGADFNCSTDASVLHGVKLSVLADFLITSADTEGRGRLSEPHLKLWATCKYQLYKKKCSFELIKRLVFSKLFCHYQSHVIYFPVIGLDTQYNFKQSCHKNYYFPAWPLNSQITKSKPQIKHFTVTVEQVASLKIGITNETSHVSTHVNSCDRYQYQLNSAKGVNFNITVCICMRTSDNVYKI